MALPDNLSTCTFVGRFLDSLGNPSRGTVVFAPSPAYVVDAGSTPPVSFDSTPVEVNIDDDGDINVVVLATDDEDLNPTGWTYRVTISIHGLPARSFDVLAPTDGNIDLTVVTPVGSSAGEATALPVFVGATAAETIAGLIVTKAVTPEGLAEFVPFVSGQSTGARPNVESGTELQAVIDATQFTGDATDPLVRKISLPAGNYPCDAALEAPDPVVFEGESSFGTRLQVGASFTPGDALVNFVQTGSSVIYGDELHTPGYGLRHLGIHGNDRALLAHGVIMGLADRSHFFDVLFRWVKGTAFRSNESLRETKFYGVDFWGCGSAGYPVLDLYQTETTDGHNLNRFVDCRWFSVGDHVRIGSTDVLSTVRSTAFIGCTFHGIPELYDGFGDSLDTTFTDPVLFDDEGAMPCRVVVENARGVEFIGCDWIAPGRGQPDILISEGTLGSSAINHVHVDGGVMKARAPFHVRYCSTIDTAADTLSTLEFGVPTLERHHMSTGSRIQFDTGSLPAPLLAATDYYVIRVDARYFKLATTRANALAGTAINLTTTGTAFITYDQQDQYVGSIDTGTDIITSVDHRMADEACIRFVTDGGSLPTGISADTDYFVKRMTKDTFKVSTTRPLLRAGTYVNITAAGSAVAWIPQVIHIDIERGQLTLTGGTVFEDSPRAIIKLRTSAATVKMDTTTISKVAGIPLIEDSTGATDTHVTAFTGGIWQNQNNTGRYMTKLNGTALAVEKVSTADVIQYGDVNGAGVNTQVFGAAVLDLAIVATTILRATSAGVAVTGKISATGEVEIDGALNHDGTTVGFYGTAPIVKQTGVAVDAAGIHAALVALGLISA